MSLLLVPPFIKYSAGPLLGPALLQSAARSKGHACSVLDLNARYIKPRVSTRGGFGRFVGDHDKPRGSNSLSDIEDEFIESQVLSALRQVAAPSHVEKRQALFGFLSHDQIKEAARVMAKHEFGKWAQEVISNENFQNPNVVGVSLLHSGQVIPATALSMITSRLWPNALVVWGGPHISGLGNKTLQLDLFERSFAADVFVTGHAEETFQHILENTEAIKLATQVSPIILNGKSLTVAPTFENLEYYDTPLTLPSQSTLGCAYGKCAFCTYPSIEDTPTKLNLNDAVGSVVLEASDLGASVSLKDSLATATRLTEIGALIGGKVPWSACTKLSTRLDMHRLSKLHANGLATLEVGLETLLPESQHRIRKIQSEPLYESFLTDVANAGNTSIVVNYMIGFPWEDPIAALAKHDDAKRILEERLGPERGKIELNHFELERMSAMARFPEVYGIDSRNVKSWPWASVMEF